MKAIIPIYHRNELETHEVVYIEYQDGYPHSVYTWHKNHVEWWDAFAEKGDKSDLRLYNSGGGGKTVQAPHYVEKYKGGSFWKSDKVEFKGEPKNATQLERPLVIETFYGKQKSKNPFKVGEIVYGNTFCNVCERNKKGSGEQTEYCDDHTYTDNNGDLRYFNHKYVQ